MLRVNGLNQYYGESHTLWDIDLEVQRGACVCVMGRNGTGKTTLLRSIMGLLPLKTGKILFEGQDIAGRSGARRARLGMAYAPQGREIFPQLTVGENLQIGLVAKGHKTREIPPRVYELFPALKKMSKRRGGDLSGGQQQQLAIGRALALEPTLLVLDEPTEGIQPNIVSEIGEIIMRLNREANLTVLLVEQKLAFARRVASHFYLMEKGSMKASGPIQDLTDQLVKAHLAV